MKRIIVAIMLASLTATLSFAEEDEFKFGVRAAFNTNFMSKIEGSSPDMGIGFGGGLVFNIPLMSSLNLNPELNVYYRKLYEIAILDNKYYQTELALSVPIMLRYKPFSTSWASNLEGAYATIGAQLDVPLTSEITAEISGQETTTKHEDRSTIDFGITFGIGYNITENFEIAGRYTMGLTSIDKNNSDMSFDQGSFSLIYYF
jgi:hypothetical protein